MDYMKYNSSEALGIIFNSCVNNNNVGELKEMYEGLQLMKNFISDVRYIYWNNKLQEALNAMEKLNEEDADT